MRHPVFGNRGFCLDSRFAEIREEVIVVVLVTKGSLSVLLIK